MVATFARGVCDMLLQEKHKSMNRIALVICLAFLSMSLDGCHKTSPDNDDDSDQISKDTDTSNSGCESGTWRCVASPTGRKQCLSSGEWGTLETCEICVDEGDCRTRLCTPSEVSCNGGTLRTCNSIGDAYASEEACSGVCDEANGECDVCAEDEQKCVNDNTAKSECSSDGQIETITECDSDLCIDGECAECQPGVVACDDSQFLNTCSNSGTWSITDCHSSNQTCYSGQCTGECVYEADDHKQCVSAVNAYQICGLDGEWGSEIECTGGDGYTTWEVCRSGGCVDSPYVNYGHTDAGSWSTRPLQDDTWMMGTITVDTLCKAFCMNVFLAGIPSGIFPSFRMAIWTEKDVSGETRPDELVVVTPGAGAINGQNVYCLSVTDRPTLEAGTTYWIGVNVTDNMQLAYRGSSAGGTGSYLSWNYVPNTNYTSDPWDYPNLVSFSDSPTVYSNYDLGIYLDVKDLF